ncbi:hypothetical protein SBOR_10104 [Sclerotinia borealis F-4128]|uniref:Uncharacterized protein n=1 Tax=Sclerotinia borealis (strain F-4128) TaxID=1432307 RepID=W9C4L2_SCLBF|nr:hypothetical protein SBOR_10104 [Sclerotinia borealis F-4128]
MHKLIRFWKSCRLVTGQKSPPLPWWQDPKTKIRQLPIPEFLEQRLRTIELRDDLRSESSKKLRMIEECLWMAKILDGDLNPAASDISRQQELLDKLEIVWQERKVYNTDDTENEMISKIRQWGKRKPHTHKHLYTSSQLIIGTNLDTSSGTLASTARSPILSEKDNLRLHKASDSLIPLKDLCQVREKMPRRSSARLSKKKKGYRARL